MRLVIPDLLPNTGYALQVRANDGANVSEWSTRFDILTIQDTVLPAAPTGASWVVSGDSFYATWSPVTTNTQGNFSYITRYEIKLVGNSVEKIISVPHQTGTNPSYTLNFETNRSLFGNPAATVDFQVRAVDNTDLKSAWTTVITATNPAPSPVTGLTATGLIDQVGLSWVAPSDTDVVGYNIYASGTSGFTPSSGNKVGFAAGTSFNFNTTTYSTWHFVVRSVDKFGSEGIIVRASATPQSPFTADTTAPATPTSLAGTIINNSNGIGARANLTWAMSSPPSDLAGFYVRYRRAGDTNYSNVTFQKDDRAGTIELQSAYTNYEFQIKSYDWSQNESAWSTTVTVTSPANAAPANVVGLTSTAGRDSIVYSWTPVADTDIKNYEVTFSPSSTFASGNVTYLTGTSTTLTVSGLAPSTTYYSRVRAVDNGGLTSSAWSATNTRATTAFPMSDGSAPSSSPAAVVSSGFGNLFVNWSAITNADPVTYEVHISTTSGFTPSGATKVSEVSGTSAVIENTVSGTPLAYGTTYYVRLIAKDRDGSAASGTQGSGSIAKVNLADTTGVTDYVASKGTDLVVNGTGMLGTNYNFSSFTFSTNDAPVGASGVFSRGLGVGGAVNIDEFIPVDPNKKLKFSFQMKELGTADDSYFYGYLVPFDAYKNQITPNHTMYIENTLTTLAAQLNPGDTTITLTSSANWYGTASKPANTSTHFRSIIWWDFVDQGGKSWPELTYSRNWSGANYWADGGVDSTTHVITLSAPYSGPTRPVGTKLSNGSSGGTYMYGTGMANVHPSRTSWTYYSSSIEGIKAGGAAPSFSTGWPPAVGYCKLGWILNMNINAVGANANSNMAVGLVSLSDAQAAQDTADAAMVTADGKNTVTWSTALPGTRANRAGDIWFVRNASGVIIAQYEGAGGTSWTSRTVDNAVIANLDAGKITTGTLSADRIGANSITAAKMVAGTITAASGILADAVITTAKIADAQVTTAKIANLAVTNAQIANGTITSAKISDLSADKITAGTVGGGFGITMAAGSSILLNGGYIKSNTYTGTTQASNPSGAGFYLGNDGIRVDSGVISASALTAGTISGANTITLSGANAKIVGTGFELSGSGLTVTSGSIQAAALNIQVGQNIMTPEYADFEGNAAGYQFYTASTTPTVEIDTNSSRFNSQSLKVSWPAGSSTHVTYLSRSSTDFNISVDGGTAYIVSGYFWNASATATPVDMWVYWYDGSEAFISTSLVGSSTLAASGTPETSTRISSAVTAPASARKARVMVRGTSTAAGEFNLDGVQFERKAANSSTPSPWTPPGGTKIDAGLIRTGSIRSSNNAVDSNGAPIIDPVNPTQYLPAWQLDTEGDAILGNAWVRGSLVVGTTTDNQNGFISTARSANYQDTSGSTYGQGWRLSSDGSTTIYLSNSGGIFAGGPLGESVEMTGAGFSVTGAPQTQITGYSVDNASGTATITSAINNPFVAGDTVRFRGMSPLFQDDDPYTVVSVPTATTFTISVPGYAQTPFTSVLAIAIGGQPQPQKESPTLISFPSDGTQPNILSGKVTTESLEVNNVMSLNGEQYVQSSAKILLASAIKDPIAPSLRITYAQSYLISPDDVVGMCIGHDNAIYTISLYEEQTTTPGLALSAIRINRYERATGIITTVYEGVLPAPVTPPPSGEIWIPVVRGFTYADNNYWLLVDYQDFADGGTNSGGVDLVRIDSSFASITNFQISTATGTYYDMGLGRDYRSATRLALAHSNVTGNSSTQVLITYLDVTGGVPATSGWGTSVINVGNTGLKTTLPLVAIGNFDITTGAGNERVVIKGSYGEDTYRVYALNASRQTLEEWNGRFADKSFVQGQMYMAACWDPSTSRFMQMFESGYVVEFAGGDAYWTNAVATSTQKWWVGLSWYDNDGGTHETKIGALSSINLYKRMTMVVSTPKIPYRFGDPETPTQARVWGYKGATAPAITSTSWKIRGVVTYPSTSVRLEMQAIPPATAPASLNNFPISAAGEIVSTSGNSYWKGDDSAQFYSLILKSGADVTTTAGNRPPLIIGTYTPGGTIESHMRVDGNEIQAMATDSTTGALLFNAGGGGINMSGADFVSLGGKTLNKWGFDKTVITTNSSGADTIAHGLGGSPQMVLAKVEGSVLWDCYISNYTSTTFTVNLRSRADNSAAGSGVSPAISWIAIR